MINQKKKDLCEKLGLFYLQKHKGDYEAAADEIERLRITNIVPCGKEFLIFLGRPGLFIGKRGENVEKIEKFMKMKVRIIENEFDINEWIIPQQPIDDYWEGYEPLPDICGHEEEDW